ncbi:MAG: HAD family hydrolase [Candidatus Woesearchaeota archaeon]
MIKLVIFDWDGTIVDSFVFIRSLGRFLIKEFDLNIKQIFSLKKITYMKFSDLTKLISNLKGIEEEKVFNILLDAALSRVYKMKYRLNLRHIKSHKENFIMGIVTNNYKKIPLKKLEETHYNFFDFVIGSNEMKDKKEAIQMKLKEYDLKPEECLLIGDSPSDMEYGKRCGVHRVWYPNIFFNNLTVRKHYDHKIKKTDDLIQLMYGL